ncbi:MAG: aldehyde dehydrogenase family protein [Actinobacteria bacterium]|nr:aldehyde dehydrogenase family protein [Actinomycetota bacterium]
MSNTEQQTAHRPTGVSVLAGVDVTGKGDTFAATAPGGGPLEPTYRSITPAQLDEAVAAAVQARRAPIDLAAFGAALDAAADALEEAADAVVATADAETALGETRLRGEHARTVAQLRMMAEEARTGSRRDVVDDPAGDGPAAPALHRTSVPLGVVGVFAASNFPLAFGVAGTDTAAALAAGCPVVAKAHPAQPATAELCGRLVAAGVAAAGLPPGTFSVVHESGYEVGQALVQHDGIDAIAFTGSLRAGRTLFDLAADRPRPIPVYAEMGSLNPLFVSRRAAAERTDALVEGIIDSYLLGEGQFCTKPGLIVLPDGPDGQAVLDGVVAALAERAPAHPLLHAGITSGFTAGVADASALPGVTAVHAPAVDGAGCQAALLQATPEAVLEEEALRREIFGPVTLAVRASDEQARDIADALEPALTASLHFTDDETGWARSLADLLARKVGRIIANGYPTGVRVSPAQHHGGPYPATTSPLHTSVGLAAVDRFRRPVAFQSFPDRALPSWA